MSLNSITVVVGLATLPDLQETPTMRPRIPPFPLALVASAVGHAALAYGMLARPESPAELFPFKRGKTTVQLVPTLLKPPVDEPPPDHRPRPIEAEAHMEPETRVTTTPVFQRVVADATAELLPARPVAAELTQVERTAEPTPEPTEPKPSPRPRRRTPDAPHREVVEQVQPFSSRRDDGAENAQPAVDVHLPHPPFPPEQPIRPMRIPLSCVIGVDGRFREVKVETGDAQWNRFLAEFVAQHWRAKPATRGGQPVPTSKSYELNYYQQ